MYEQNKTIEHSRSEFQSYAMPVFVYPANSNMQNFETGTVNPPVNELALPNQYFQFRPMTQKPLQQSWRPFFQSAIANPLRRSKSDESLYAPQPAIEFQVLNVQHQKWFMPTSNFEEVQPNVQISQPTVENSQQNNLPDIFQSMSVNEEVQSKEEVVTVLSEVQSRQGSQRNSDGSEASLEKQYERTKSWTCLDILNSDDVTDLETSPT